MPAAEYKLTVQQYDSLLYALKRFTYEKRSGDPTLSDDQFYAYVATLLDPSITPNVVTTVGPGLVLDDGELTLDADALATQIPAPDYVATSNITLNGSQSVDGATPATGKLVLCVAQTNPAENGWHAANTAGAWTAPSFYNTDAGVAAMLGIPTGTVTNGLLGTGSVWVQWVGATLAGAKSWRRLPDAADKAVVACLLPSGDTTGVNDSNAIVAALTAAKVHGGTVQLPTISEYYVNKDLSGAEICQGVRLIGSGGGSGGDEYSTRIVRVGGPTFATGYRSFSMPAPNANVVVTVDSTVGMFAGKLCYTNAVNPAGLHFEIVSFTSNTVTLKNLPSTSNSGVTLGTVITADFLWPNDSIVQMRSGQFASVADLQLRAASPLYNGFGINFDGNVFANDVGHSAVWDAAIRSSGWPIANPPLLALNASTHPAATLTGSAALCMDLLVEILSATTYRYSTDGGLTYDEGSGTTPLTIAATHVFPATSTAYGLTLNLPATGYLNGYKYSCRLGIQRGVNYQSCFTVSTTNVRFDRVMHGIVQAGQSGTHIQCAGLTMGGYLAKLEGCNFIHLSLDCEPGGRGLGRGGVYSSNGRSGRFALNAGDELTEGPWVTLVGESGTEVDGIFGIASTATGTAGAAVSLLGCIDTTLKGTYYCNRVFDVSKTGTTTIGVFVEQAPGFVYNGVSNTLFSGGNIGFVSYRTAAAQTLSNVRMVNAADSFFGLVCGPGTQILASGCLNVGGYRQTPLVWGGNSGASVELCSTAVQGFEGVGYYPPQNVASAGHGFYVRDTATAVTGQRFGLYIDPLGISHPNSAIVLANGANDNIVIKSSYAEASGPTGAFSVSGFVPGTFKDGQLLRLVWAVPQPCTIKHDALSSAANRTVTPTAADVLCATPGAGGYGWADFQYSLAASRWRLIGHT